jgi:hypothetical protein
MTNLQWHIRERRRLHQLLRHAAREDERLYGIPRAAGRDRGVASSVASEPNLAPVEAGPVP